MIKPSLSQIVNLCKEQNMHQMYVVEGHESKLVVTDEVLAQYPDVEIDALTVEMFSTEELALIANILSLATCVTFERLSISGRDMSYCAMTSLITSQLKKKLRK